jgi:hypothetical protein
VRKIGVSTLTAVAIQLLMAGSVAAKDQAVVQWLTKPLGTMTLEYTAADSQFLSHLEQYLTNGRQTVQTFFGQNFPDSFIVRVFPSRKVMTEYWRAEWNMPDLETQCWMVASGTATTLSLLSPRVWDVDACEHDPSDTVRTQLVITHEMVHTFHGQFNPRPEFEGLDSIGWFLEGLAVYASGQLKAGYLATAKEALDSARTPAALEDAWSGKYRYGVSGSIVEYLDTKYGRKATIKLLPLTSEQAILSALGVSEDQLLKDWRAWLRDRGGN